MPRPPSAQTGYHGNLLGSAGDPTVGKRVRMSRVSWENYQRRKGLTEEARKREDLVRDFAAETLREANYDGNFNSKNREERACTKHAQFHAYVYDDLKTVRNVLPPTPLLPHV